MSSDQQHPQVAVDDPADHPATAPAQRRSSISPSVLWPSLAVLGTAVALAIVFPDRTGEVLGRIQTDIVGGFGWYYSLLVAGFVIFALWMGLSRFGDITLGLDDDEPEFSLPVWFAMLFAAGMGIGLVFWGAAEPLTFFESPKPGVAGTDTQLAQTAMSQVYLHWGFHAWAIYVVVGLALAYAIHRKGHPVSIRWALEPLIGDRARGRLGDAVDIVAVVGTVAGVATSLGLGVQQISAGLVHLGLFDEASDLLMVGVIAVITAIAVFSVVTGVDKGIKWLSNTNLILAGVFMVAVLALGPTLFLLREFVQSIGVYLRDVVPMTFNTSAFTGAEGQAWQASWTTFYWGWWISWAPFVGVFIARISRGRTIRQFVAGVLLVPTLVTFLWFSVFGGSAIHRELFGEGGLVGADGSIVSENVLFDLVGDLPLGGLLSGVAIVLVVIFFVTSSDSGSLVVDMIASGGELDPPKWSRIMWACLAGALAIGLLLAGGLVALQTGAIITALPFSFVMVGMCLATYRAVSGEHRLLLRAERRQRREELSAEVGQDVTGRLTRDFDEHFGEHVDRHVTRILHRRRRGE
ncbi:BCCT family transporter [Nocardioides ferulae]|uniref:BCCT family transporter n=1 Tax=Nocardioides ferulae TaxID=2340821 RepID=UPI001F0C8DC2|nr:BCCT family transporter [Nocardioides ferulae]